MPSVKSFILVLVIAACSFVIASPHGARGVHHRALVHRIASPQLQDAPASFPVKRTLRKRCKQRPGSSSKPAPPPLATVAPSPSPSPSSTKDEDDTKPTAPPPPPPSPSKTKTKAPEETSPPPPPPPPPTTGDGDGNLPSYMTGPQTGQGTFYDTGLGACGIVNNNRDFIAAVSRHLFDSFPGYQGGNPNKNPMCGRKVRASYQGKSVVVALIDRCDACSLTDLDFSPAAFEVLAPFSVGRISGMTWEWLD